MYHPGAERAAPARPGDNPGAVHAPRPTARDLAADVLLAYAARGQRVKDGLERVRAGVRDPRERGLLTEAAYGTVRHQGTLDVCLAAFSRRALDALDLAALVGLRLALYQVLFLDRVPPSAAVDHAVGWVRSIAGPGAAGYVNGVLRGLLRGLVGRAEGPEDPRRDVPREDGSALRFVDPLFPDPGLAPAQNLGARYAMPPWLVERRLQRLGLERTRALLRTEGRRPAVTLRVRRGSVDDLRRRLAGADPGARPGPVDGSLLLPAGEGAALGPVARGEAAVQDATAQRVAPLLAPRRGERVLDLCAAPGGKALHLADLLAAEGGGEVLACDVDPRKVEGLEALRAQVPAGVGWRTATVPAEGPLPFEPASFDAVLVDAPCSNTGVLRRRVEARWRLRPEHIPALAAQQGALLRRALPLLRPGGRLLYSTCSVEPEENVEVVARLAAERPQLRVTEGFDVLPADDADGGFAALLGV